MPSHGNFAAITQHRFTFLKCLIDSNAWDILYISAASAAAATPAPVEESDPELVRIGALSLTKQDVCHKILPAAAIWAITCALDGKGEGFR